MKKLPALIASLVITALVALAMLAIGVNSLLNPTQTAAANAPASDAAIINADQAGATTGANTSTDANAAAQVKQLQDRIAQYQAREKQYQQQLNQAKQELSQANQQIQQANTEVQQYQQVLQQLQQAGVISIDSNGNISLGRRSRGGFFGGEGSGDNH